MYGKSLFIGSFIQKLMSSIQTIPSRRYRMELERVIRQALPSKAKVKFSSRYISIECLCRHYPDTVHPSIGRNLSIDQQDAKIKTLWVIVPKPETLRCFTILQTHGSRINDLREFCSIRSGFNAYLVEKVRDSPYIAREHVLESVEEEEDDPEGCSWHIEVKMTSAEASINREHLLFFLSGLKTLGVM